MALSIGGREYNVYLAGEPYLGRTHFARTFLDPAAARGATPPDWLYVHNFDDPDRPRAVSLPAGQGKRFKTALAKAVADLREDIPARFEREAYLNQKQSLLRGYNAGRDTVLDEMEAKAKNEGYSLFVDDQSGYTLYPLLEGKVVSDEEFERLDPDLKKTLKAKGDLLLEEMGTALRRLSKEERGYHGPFPAFFSRHRLRSAAGGRAGRLAPCRLRRQGAFPLAAAGHPASLYREGGDLSSPAIGQGFSGRGAGLLVRAGLSRVSDFKRRDLRSVQAHLRPQAFAHASG